MIRSARQGICTEFWRRRGLEDVHLIDQEGDWRITLRRILGRKVVRIKDGCKGLGSCPVAGFGLLTRIDGLVLKGVMKDVRVVLLVVLQP